MAVNYAYPLSPNYATGPWLDTAAGNIDDPQGTPNDADFTYFNPFAINEEYYGDWAMGPAPTGLTNISVKLWIRAWCRGHNAVTVDHRLWGYMRIAGVEYDSATPIDIIGTTNNQGDNPQWYTYVFANNPATAGSWILSDFPGLNAGGHFKVLTSVVGTSTPYCKQSSVYLEITGDPITGNVEPSRSVLSPVLRIFRKKKRYFDLHGRCDLFDAAILGRLAMTHRNAPSVDGGWGVEPWKRGSVIVLGSEVQVDDSVIIHCMDTEDFDTTLWTPLYNDISVSPADLSGIARVDLGSGWNHTATGMRNQLAYVPRPIDSLYNEVAANQWKVSRDGLHVEAGTVTNLLLNSSFSLGAGAAMTSWTPTDGTGGGSHAEDTADYLFDAAGKRRSVKLIGGSTGETWELQLVAITNVAAQVVILYKNDTAGASSIRFALLRSSDGRWWNDAAGTWDVAQANNFLPDSLGLPAEYRSKLVTASGAVNYTLYLIAPLSKTVHFYQAGLLWDSGTNTEIFSRTPIITTTVAVTRTADLPYFGNDDGKRGWNPDSGRAYFEFRPDWSHADIADGRTIFLLSSVLADTDGAAGGGNRYMDAVFYIRDSSTAGRWVFRRYLIGRIGATYFDAEVAVSSAAGSLPARGTWIRFGARWASLLGEWGLGTRGLSLWVDPGPLAVVSSSVANPTVITTAVANGLVTGDVVTLSGHVGSTPALNGTYPVTVTSTTTFTIPVNVAVAGTGGIITKATPLVKAAQAGNTIQDAQMVEWVASGTGFANVTPDGWTLRKTSGADLTFNAGSYSVQSLASGDGYIEFVVNNGAHIVAMGFNSDPTTDVNYTSIDFCLYANAGEFRVYENGVLKYTGAGEAAAGVVLRVEIVGGGVKYYSQGVLKYTSVTPVITYPLYADCSFWTLNAYIKRAVMAGTVAADGTRRLSGAVNPRMPQDAVSKIWMGTVNGSTNGPASGTFRKLDFSARPGSDAALARLMLW